MSLLAAVNVTPHRDRVPEFDPWVGQIVALSLICGSGIVLNIMVLVISGSRELWESKATTLVCSLAVADLLHLVVNWPFNLYMLVNYGWDLGQPVCKLRHFLQMATLAVSMLTLMALAHDRSRAVIEPIRVSVSSSLNSRVIAGSIWLLSAIIATPDAVYSVTQSGIAPNGYIYYVCTFSAHDLMWVTCSLFVVSFLFVSYSYLSLAVKVLTRPAVLGTSHEEYLQNRRRRVARLVLLLTALFFTFAGPAQIYDVLIRYQLVQYTLPRRYTLQDMMIAHSAINPLALLSLSGAYRKRVLSIAKSCKLKAISTSCCSWFRSSKSAGDLLPMPSRRSKRSDMATAVTATPTPHKTSFVQDPSAFESIQLNVLRNVSDS